jgi:hypothetical protein
MTVESHYSKIFNVGIEKYRVRIVARGIIMEGSEILVCKKFYKYLSSRWTLRIWR